MVVLYFARAQSGLNAQDGCLWLYNDAHNVLLQTRVHLQPLKEDVEVT